MWRKNNVLGFFRTRDEIQEVRQTRDPITGFREKLVASGLADPDELKAIEVRHLKQDFWLILVDFYYFFISGIFPSFHFLIQDV